MARTVREFFVIGHLACYSETFAQIGWKIAPDNNQTDWKISYSEPIFFFFFKKGNEITKSSSPMDDYLVEPVRRCRNRRAEGREWT